MKTWTVVGLYLNTNMPTVDWVEAKTGNEAENQIECAREAGESSFIVVAVFEGKHKDELT